MAADPADLPGITILGLRAHEAWQRRDLPPVERLDGGLWSIPVPIPDNPLRYTLTYLVPGDDGIVVVDPGWYSDDSWEALTSGLKQAGASVSDVVGVVVTHVHPDHHGLSARLRAESGAWIAMHPAERDTLPARLARKFEAGGRGRDMMANGLRASGVPDAEIDTLLTGMDRPGTPRTWDMAEPDVLLEDGDAVPLRGRRLLAVWTPGHTPGHLCLREPDARLLLTGDHVLPRITPNIGLNPANVQAPLHRFLDSLDKVAVYDDHDVLPAHEYRFRGLAARTRQLREHHDARCREVLGVVDELGAATMWQLAENLTWSRPWAEVGRMRMAALAETAAHANHLVDQGELGWDSTERLPARLRRVPA
jgi:glyoxylase-like metal-dependent hydrolase (beta-lactamase superfamily II)